MLRQKRAGASCGVATLVVDERTKRLCQRACPGQVAILCHADVDEVAAESLLRARVQAVINTAPFLTGAYPALGAKRLMEAGVPLYEAAEDARERLMQLPDGTPAVLGDGRLRVRMGDEWREIAAVRSLSMAEVHAKWREATRRLDQTLSQFIDNTLMTASKEKNLFLKPLGKLPLSTQIVGRHVVLVSRGKHYRQDLRMLASYIREYRPVLIAVDGGADALLEQGYVPDLIVGDMDSVSDRALCCGAEVVVHAYPDGDAPGEQRVRELGIPCHVLPAPGTSEDVAMLLAYEEQAKLIVTIGAHTNMIDFLEKGRKGMASTLLVRTKIGPRLIDAKGVSQLYQPRLSWKVYHLLAVATVVLAFGSGMLFGKTTGQSRLTDSEQAYTEAVRGNSELSWQIGEFGAQMERLLENISTLFAEQRWENENR